MRSGKYGTALGAAAYHGKLEIAKLLLARGADPDLTSNEGSRPRDLAEQGGHQDLVDLLDSNDVERKPNEPTDNACP